MNEYFYKKSGMVISKVARDLMTMSPGNKIPSVSEYSKRLSVSRGVIQQALAFLEENHGVQFEKSHGKGTILHHIDFKKLREYTGWDIITINLPLPATSSLSSLTSALYQQNNYFTIPLAMVYVTGSENRLYYLEKKIYDTTVVSLSTAKRYCSQYDFLDEPLVLNNCSYAGQFCAYFSNPLISTVQDGMRVAFDPSSSDHYRITQAMCKGKKVVWVETPIVALSEALKNGKADVIFHRHEFPMLQFEHLNPRPVMLDDFSTADTTTPTLLFNKNNYGIRQLFSRYLHMQNLQSTQQKVLKGELDIRFF